MPPCKKLYLKKRGLFFPFSFELHGGKIQTGEEIVCTWLDYKVTTLVRRKAERNLNGLGFSLLIQIQFVVLEFKALDTTSL